MFKNRTSASEAALQQRFCALLKNLSHNFAENAPTLWQNLRDAYQQPHRKYHTLQHINECLQLFDRFQHLAEQPLAVEFALWFHDIVYQPQQHNNEQQSALWAAQILQQAQVPAALIQKITALIMATAHQQPPQDNDEKLLVDIDLAILAAPAVRFTEYQQQIRAEYAWVEKSVYQQKRQEILTRLYNSGDIYHHLEIQKALANLAHANLQPTLAIKTR